jgi:hypothetical protein
MNARATVKVRPEVPGTALRPDRARLEAAAHLLTKCGFNVLRIGRFGVNIEGPEAAFRQKLGVDVSGAQHLVVAAQPRTRELGDLLDTVEIAGAPTYFKG